MKDLLNSVYKSNLEILRDENDELRKTNCGLIEGNIVLKNKIENLSKVKKPTSLEILKIAIAFCKLQLGVKNCSDCMCYKSGCCGWFRDRIITLQSVDFVINEWEKIRS